MSSQIVDNVVVKGQANRWGPVPVTSYNPVRLSSLGHQVMDAGMPSLAELARAGKLFTLSGGVVANAVAPVTDMPTTAAAEALYNGNPVGSGVYIFPVRISQYAASGTLGLGRALIAGMSTAAQSSAVAAGTGAVGPTKNKPDSTTSSNATLGLSVTLAGAPAWQVIGGLDTPAAVEIGAGISVDVAGCYCIPPGYALGLHCLGPTGTTAKFLYTVMYAEFQVDPS